MSEAVFFLYGYTMNHCSLFYPRDKLFSGRNGISRLWNIPWLSNSQAVVLCFVVSLGGNAFF